MKILILKPSSLGDVVHAIPVLRLLKRHDPSHEIFWWISVDLVPLLEKDPDLAGIFPFDRHCWAYPRCWRLHLESIQRMRSHRFDVVIDLQGLARSGLFGWLARGKLMIGIDDPREGASGFYDMIVPRPSAQTHAVDWYLEALRRMNVPRHWDFDWLPRRAEAAASIEKKWPVRRARWILLHPGARWQTKRWPIERFQELVSLLTTQHPDTNVAIMGSRTEMELGRAIARTNPPRCLDLTGQTSIPEMIEWIRRSEIMICNDTGPMHIAAALNKPVVAIFGPTDPRRTGPYRQIDSVLRTELPCAPCLISTCRNAISLECLLGIRPAHVFECVQQRLARGSSLRSGE